MLKEQNNQIIVDTYAMEVYLPAEYATSAYRGTPYYSVLGTKVRFLGVGNMRFYKNEKELENPDSVKCYPLGVPMLITTEPSEIDIREIRLTPNGRPRKSIVFLYMKGDALLTNKETIKLSDAMMMLLSRLEQGKIDHVPPEVAVQIVMDCETMNGINLRIPSEEMEIFVAERYRDPSSPTRKYRYHTGAVDLEDMVMYNMRTDAMQSTTYQGLTHEDVSTALITAVNRKEAGIIDEPGQMESLVLGKDLSKWSESDAKDSMVNVE